MVRGYTFSIKSNGACDQDSDIGHIVLSNNKLNIIPNQEPKNVIVNGVIKGTKVSYTFPKNRFHAESQWNKHEVVCDGDGNNVYLTSDTLIIEYRSS